VDTVKLCCPTQSLCPGPTVTMVEAAARSSKLAAERFLQTHEGDPFSPAILRCRAIYDKINAGLSMANINGKDLLFAKERLLLCSWRRFFVNKFFTDETFIGRDKYKFTSAFITAVHCPRPSLLPL
jgi:hypothetical protein